MAKVLFVTPLPLNTAPGGGTYVTNSAFNDEHQLGDVLYAIIARGAIRAIKVSEDGTSAVSVLSDEQHCFEVLDD